MGTILRFQNDLIVMPGRTSNGEPTFPWKLHTVLEESERLGFQDIVSWQGDRAFKVHDPKRFELHILKKYFKQTQYRSFTRQLNMYNFQRVPRGSGVGSYTHEFLMRGKTEMCCFMLRTKIKKNGRKGLAVNREKRSQVCGNKSFATPNEQASIYLKSKTDIQSNSSNVALLDLSKVESEPTLIKDPDSVIEIPSVYLKNDVIDRTSLSCKINATIHDMETEDGSCTPKPFVPVLPSPSPNKDDLTFANNQSQQEKWNLTSLSCKMNTTIRDIENEDGSCTPIPFVPVSPSLSPSKDDLTFENDPSQQEMWNRTQLQYQLRDLSSQIQKLTREQKALLDQLNENISQQSLGQDIENPTREIPSRSTPLIGLSAFAASELAYSSDLDLDTIFDDE